MASGGGQTQTTGPGEMTHIHEATQLSRKLPSVKP